MRQASRRVRKAEDAEIGKLSSAVMEAIAIRDQMKADGVTGAELNAGLEGVLRDVWPKPKGRSEPWRVICKICDDTGAELKDCAGDGCGMANGHPHAPHEYRRPCLCSKGARFRETTKGPGDVTDVGRARSGFSRMGR